MKFIKTALVLFGLLISAVFLAPSQVAAQDGQAVTYDSTLYGDMEFRTVGPTRGGRVTAVEGHRQHPGTFYMGAAGGGGVWRTTNYGNSWHNLTDGKGFKSTSIGAIEVADSDTSIIYVGTGSDGIRANVTTGRGIYKSDDTGESWQFLGLEKAGQIGAVEVHPENPELVYVAALGHPFGKNSQRGVFRSKDGGENWEKVLFLSDSTGAIDLELNPENPDEIYASMWQAERKPWTIISGADVENGIYKSTDGGDNWKKMEQGLPQGLMGKVDFAVTPANPDRIYALVEAPGDQQGLYRSDDRGKSWTQTSDKEEIMTRPFYFTNITAHPTNPDKVYVGNVRYWVSSDGGENFDRRSVTHADVHDLWINPDDPKLQVQGNDGGATVTLDGGESWSTQYNQPTAELYQVNVDNQFPYWLYSGQQDNSTISVPSLPPAESSETNQGLWHMVGGCETGPAVPQINNSTIVFANCKGRFGRYNKQTGQEKQYWVGAQYMYGRNPSKLKYRFQRVSPIEVSPHDSSVVYHGSQYLHRTNNGGKNWETISPDLTAFKDKYQVTSGRPINRDITGEEHFSTLYSIQVSPHNPDVIWTGANDGPVYVTRSGGEEWANVTPDNLPPNGRVAAIEVSPHTPGKAYATVQRRLLKDFHPYIYKTSDYGQSWTLLTNGENGIPADYPTRVVREDPDRKGVLYGGTDFGLFVSFDDGNNWQQLEQGLPVTPITEIRVHNKDLVLSTMGRGFWILDNLTPLHQLNDQIASSDYHLYQPRDAYRTDYWGGGSEVPQYPESGAMIDFYLTEVPQNELTLDILDSDGEVIRRFVGTSDQKNKDTQTPDDRGNMMAPGPEKLGKPDSIKLKQGHNRFTWDLRYPNKPVASADGEMYFGVGAGPLAVPGEYKVRLTIGDWTQVRNLQINIDPRVKADGVSKADLQAQLDLNLKIRDAIGQASKMAAAIDTLRNNITSATESGTIDEDRATTITEQLDGIYKHLVTSDEGSYQPPMWIDQAEYMYYMTISADQRPGNDAYTRFETLNKELKKIAKEWKQFRQNVDLPEEVND
ncbi:Uncharacterized protein LX73_1059 [Fodinibius salinus]|uniref:Sortilin N-terminal domain-containing protein n=1 Tax=Fodinibius salinus TaxID=860790 RepID=A0A5D3YIN3_9BACT|nr:hypothetical protein [Fodinibius salinus]TYP93358.1 Uncharacterized protein LX73_1059 [Fodinibius salinus]